MGEATLPEFLLVLSFIQSRVSRISGLVGRDSRLVATLRPAYEFFLDVVSLGRGIPWTINDEGFRIDARHRRQMPHVYEPEVARVLRERLRPGMTFADVGANVGIHVLQAARIVGPAGRVIAFEPNPTAFSALGKNVRLNGFEDRVTMVHSAVGGATGRALLYAQAVDGMSRLGSANPLLENARPVDTIVGTLDNFFDGRLPDPDVILIDVEGNELDVLDGARALLRRTQGKSSIFAEVHPADYTGWGTDGIAATEFLASLDLTARAISGQRDPLRDYGMVELVHNGGRAD